MRFISGNLRNSTRFARIVITIFGIPPRGDSAIFSTMLVLKSWAVASGDPLGFVDSKPYTDRLDQAIASSGLPEAIISAKGLAGGHLVYAGAMDMSFIGGSMGSAVGEKNAPDRVRR